MCIRDSDVALARAFADRIVAFKAGALVFDGPPEALDEAALTLIYGAEDWDAAGAAEAMADTDPDHGVPA